jgi:glycine/D-amino acid oxidase-like deaminating enzyme
MPTTIILGTGIIGLSTAYYLSQFTENEDVGIAPASDSPVPGTSTSGDTEFIPRQKHEIHLVDSSPELFASASGKAAGFLAKDWFTPAVAPLGEFSFDLHRKLAEEHDGRSRWGYSGSSSYSLDRDDEDDENEDEEEDPSQQSAAKDSTDTNTTNAATTQTHRGRSRKNDLDWLMSGSSRSTLLDDPQKAVSEETDEDNLPRWLRAKLHSLQVISDITTTGQVCVSHLNLVQSRISNTSHHTHLACIEILLMTPFHTFNGLLMLTFYPNSRDPYRLCQFLLEQCRARGVKLHQPARATQLRHSDLDAPSLSSKTQIRLEYIGPSNDSPDQEMRGSPNSQSPPSEAPIDNDGSTQRSSKDTIGKRDSWASFSSPLDGSSQPSIPSSQADDYFIPLQNSQNNFVDIQCDSIVIAAGCWTPRVYRTLFPNAGRIPRVTALAGHSVVLKSKHWPPPRPGTLHKLPSDVADVVKPNIISGSTTGSSSTITSPNGSPPLEVGQNVPSPASSESSETITAFYPSPNLTPPTEPKKMLTSTHSSMVPRPFPCHAVFTSDPAGYSPEIFSRLGGDVWVGGYNSSSIPLPAIATWSVPQPDTISILVKTGKALCGDDVNIIREGLCFRPVVPTGRPVIARMHEADLGDGVKVSGGVFVATGHGPWGISLSLGTGYVVSEMVLGRETSVDVKLLSTWEAQAL